MRYVISEKTGSVFWKENNEIVGAPIWADSTFTTTEAEGIETWGDADPTEKQRVLSLLSNEV